MNKIAHKEYKENEMRNYRKFDFASLRNRDCKMVFGVIEQKTTWK